MNTSSIKTTVSIAFVILAAGILPGQTPGCPDPRATNYNPAATVNDGSCRYRDTTLSIVRTENLSQTLNETSGLIWWRDLLWTHNDDTDTKIYGLDRSGSIQDSFALKSPGNKDWEEIAQDERFIYIGDFGNNGTGKRDDLHILRISKDSTGRSPVAADTIWFRYALQDSSSISGPNNTDFDCEAFLVQSDTILLFTKEWVSQQTTVYRLPARPGHHIAEPIDTIRSNGMITGAAKIDGEGIVVLCGYTRSLGQPFLMLLYDHPHFKFSRGNQRKVYLDLYFHQIEAIEHEENWRFFLTNERGGIPPIAVIPASLHEIDLRGLLEKKPTGTGQHFQENKNEGIRVFPNPFDDSFHIRFDPGGSGGEVLIADQGGRLLYHDWSGTGQVTIDASEWPNGIYRVVARGHSTSCIKIGP